MLAMAVPEMLGAATTLAMEVNGQKRTNYLHRESIAQSLRIHESEANAAKEYHRVEMRQQNDQHARGLLQSQVQHEESVDLEKRIAIRENLRDEWEQLTDKAETMLIVNTLMLGIACAFLIEGQFPDEVTIFVPMAPVTYLSLLAFTICSLLLSVRFALVLRFRVGQTIVREMRQAMRRAFHVDSKFRNCEHYQKCNRARIIPPVCDDPAHPGRSLRVQPLTRQLTESNLRTTVFHEKPNNNCDDLSWINDETGYHTMPNISRSWLRLPRMFSRSWFGCQRRSEYVMDPADVEMRGRSDIEATEMRGIDADERDDMIRPDDPRRTNVGYDTGLNRLDPSSSTTDRGGLRQLSARTRLQGNGRNPARPAARPGRQISRREQVPYTDDPGSLRPIDSGSQTQDSGSLRAIDSFRSELSAIFTEPEGEQACEENDSCHMYSISPSERERCESDAAQLQAEFDQIAQSYSGLLAIREMEDQYLNSKLDRLRRGWCKPYDIYCQFCFWSGTVAVFVSAITLTYGRWMTPRMAVSGGPLPSSTLASLSFMVMLSGMIAIMICMERRLACQNMPAILEKHLDDADSAGQADTMVMLHDVDAALKNGGTPEAPVEDSLKGRTGKDHIPSIFTPILYTYLIVVGVSFVIAQHVESRSDLSLIGQLELVDLYWNAHGATTAGNQLLVVGGYKQLNVTVDAEENQLSFASESLSHPVTDLCMAPDSNAIVYLTRNRSTGDTHISMNPGTQIIPAERLGCGEDVWIAFADSFERVTNIAAIQHGKPLQYDAVVRRPPSSVGMKLTAFESTKDGLYAMYDGAWIIRLRDNSRRFVIPVEGKRWVAMAALSDSLLLISDGNKPFIGKIPL